MLLIVILPDVDLPDTAFHRGTAPILVHARATRPPAAVTVANLSRTTMDAPDSRFRESVTARFSSEPNFRSILIRSIRC